jgi:hypothetical protein
MSGWTRTSIAPSYRGSGRARLHSTISASWRAFTIENVPLSENSSRCCLRMSSSTVDRRPCESMSTLSAASVLFARMPTTVRRSYGPTVCPSSTT